MVLFDGKRCYSGRNVNLTLSFLSSEEFFLLFEQFRGLKVQKRVCVSVFELVCVSHNGRMLMLIFC